MAQPIIRGIQSVGSVDIWYKYNGGVLYDSAGQIKLMNGNSNALGSSEGAGGIQTSEGIQIAGFRLDGEFLRANPQIASSAVIPILGGGGVALTNNNRTGTLSFNCAKVSVPSAVKSTTEAVKDSNGNDIIDGGGNAVMAWGADVGAMVSGSGVGPVDSTVKVYDMTLIAQLQMSQAGGDALGATICVNFWFNGILTKVQFEGCTVATVDPLALSGNDAASYNIVFNYLNWKSSVGEGTPGFIA